MIQRTLTHLLPFVLIPLAFACKNKQQAATETTTTTPPPVIVDQSGPRFGGSAEADSLFFSLERTPCFGACPAFRIKIYRSGSATYEGRGNVERMGMHSGSVTPEMMEDLLTKAEGYGFFGMNDTYDAQVTDLPSTIIQVNSNGRMKKVVARVGTPPAFKSFAGYAERALTPLEWTSLAPKQ